MNIYDTYVKIFYAAFVFTGVLFIAASPAIGEENNLPASIEQLKKTTLPAYAANKLSAIEQDLSGFAKHYLNTTNEEETIHELIRMLK